VLVAGGISNSNGILSSCELYDPTTDTWSTTVSMSTAREGPTATLLPNGNVLITGGGNSLSGALNSCELYYPNH